MNILTVSNLYPPHLIGGYEILCREVVEYLQANGHQVTVLTSDYGLDEPAREGSVLRILRDHVAHPKEIKLAHIPLDGLLDRDPAQLRALVRAGKPDLILVFSLSRLSPYLFPALQALPVPKVYQISDPWMFDSLAALDEKAGYWKVLPPAGAKRRIKSFLAPLVLKRLRLDREGLCRAHFAYISRFMQTYYREHGAAGEGRVIYHGVDTDAFTCREAGAPAAPFKFLYTGQIIEHKGVHTIVEAAARLKTQQPDAAFTVDLVGSTTAPSYYLKIESMIAERRLTGVVRLCGAVDRAQLAATYQQASVSLFSSTCDEAFGLTILEAMACGLPVIGTGVGGSAEIIRHDDNGLIYRPGDPAALAAAMARLLGDATLTASLGRSVRQTVEKQFNKQDRLREFATFLEGVKA